MNAAGHIGRAEKLERARSQPVHCYTGVTPPPPRRLKALGFRGLGHFAARTEFPSVAGTGSAALCCLTCPKAQSFALRETRPVSAARDAVVAASR